MYLIHLYILFKNRKSLIPLHLVVITNLFPYRYRKRLEERAKQKEAEEQLKEQRKKIKEERLRVEEIRKDHWLK